MAWQEAGGQGSCRIWMSTFPEVPQPTEGSMDDDLPPARCGSDQASHSLPLLGILVGAVMTQFPGSPHFCHADVAPATLTCLSALLSFFIPLMNSVLPFKCCSNSPRVMSPFSIRTCGMWGSAEMRSMLGGCPNTRAIPGTFTVGRNPDWKRGIEFLTAWSSVGPWEDY